MNTENIEPVEISIDVLPVTEPVIEAVAEDYVLEKPKVKKPPTQKQLDAWKKPRTENQKNAFKAIIEKRDANRGARKAEKETVAIVTKEKIDQKIVKKAVSLKKKEIIQQAVLDDISSDDDIPLEIIQKLKEKQQKRKQATVSKAQKAPVEKELVQQTLPYKNKYTFV